MTSEVVIRPYEEGDEVGINAGFNRAFNTTRALEDWHWKYPAEPEGRWIMVAVAEDGGVVAYYGAVPSRFRCGEVTVRAGQITDVYAVPEVQGRHIFTRCYEAFIERFGNARDLPLMYGFPGGRHLLMGLKALKYVLLPPVPAYRRPAHRRHHWPSWRLRLRRGFDRGAVDALWERAASRYPWGNLRNGAWLERRFTGRPGVAYRHLSVWRGETPCAWGVAREMAGKLMWAELIWDGEDPASLARLARAMEREAVELSCPKIELWLRGDPPAEAVLRDEGFASVPHPLDLQMVARSFREEVDLGLLGRELYLTAGDTDLV